MLKIVGSTEYTTTVQFTGADLKEWYRELGQESVFICHVTMKKVSEILCRPWAGSCIESRDMINELRRAVPNRFMKTPSASSTVHRHMLKKYRSRVNFGSYHTRSNLIGCVPDDFIFTFELK